MLISKSLCFNYNIAETLNLSFNLRVPYHLVLQVLYLKASLICSILLEQPLKLIVLKAQGRDVLNRKEDGEEKRKPHFSFAESAL